MCSNCWIVTEIRLYSIRLLENAMQEGQQHNLQRESPSERGESSNSSHSKASVKENLRHIVITRFGAKIYRRNLFLKSILLYWLLKKYKSKI